MITAITNNVSIASRVLTEHLCGWCIYFKGLYQKAHRTQIGVKERVEEDKNNGAWKEGPYSLHAATGHHWLDSRYFTCGIWMAICTLDTHQRCKHRNGQPPLNSLVRSDKLVLMNALHLRFCETRCADFSADMNRY
jgi:hypothetical protein